MKRALVPALLLAMLGTGCAKFETTPPVNVTGNWVGRCDGCPAGDFTLVATQNGDRVEGTLAGGGASGLGENPMPLQGGTITGRRLTFAVIGADGVPFTAHFTLTDDSHALVGQAQYRVPFALTFRRH